MININTLTTKNIFFSMKYKVYTQKTFKNIPQIQRLSAAQIFDIEVLGEIFPFKVNNYVIDELIDWDNFSKDSIFRLTFPQKGMLSTKHFDKMAQLIQAKATSKEITKASNEIRLTLNPNPSG
ncbi:MAG: L-lysine 2,3-aminomutase, partial [Ancylomarina sp.]